MATLYVRGMPEELYEQLKKRAAQEGRSVSQEAVRLLRLGLLAARPKPDPEFAAWLTRVSEQRARWAAQGRKFPDSVKLVREARRR